VVVRFHPRDTWLVSRENVELDHERILVLGHQGGRGKTSGLELGQVDSH
jgi:hypothetical protein